MLLRCLGYDPVVRIGGERRAGGFRAHAWVEVDDRPVGDAPGVGDRYEPFDEPLIGSL